MVHRFRLSRKSKLGSSDTRLRSQFTKQLVGMPSGEVHTYASLSDSVTGTSGALFVAREEAKRELKRRAQLEQMAQQSKYLMFKGDQPVLAMKGEPFSRKLVRGAQKAVQFAGREAREAAVVARKGGEFAGKLASGTYMTELEESISTAGMTPAGKKSFLAKEHRERARLSRSPVDHDDFSVGAQADEMAAELRRARREAMG
jgi:hypothetical protein